MSNALAHRLAMLLDEEEHSAVFTPEFLDHLREHVEQKTKEQEQEQTKAEWQRTKQEIIADYIRTPAGRQRLAESMATPLRRSMSLASIGRRLFVVEPLPAGALPIYDSSTEE